MNAGRQGCVHAMGGEKDEDGGSVNEVTRLLIGNELRLGVFNESVQVSSSLPVSARTAQGRDGRGDIRRETRVGACSIPEMCRKQPEIRARTLQDKTRFAKNKFGWFQ